MIDKYVHWRKSPCTVSPSTEFRYPNSLVKGHPLKSRMERLMKMNVAIAFAVGTMFGGAVGVVIMCLFQVNHCNDCEVKQNEKTDR